MNMLSVIVVGVSAIAVALGALLGWTFGILHQKKVTNADLTMQVAYRLNAAIDFKDLRERAEKIVALANSIAITAGTAHDTVSKSLSLSNSVPGPGPHPEHSRAFGGKALEG